MAANKFARGDVWLANFDPVQGREQAGSRPCLIVSADGLNRSRAELVIVVPLTSKFKNIPSHVAIKPPEGNLKVASYAMCEAVRSISTFRLTDFWGTVSKETLEEVAEKLRLLLEL